MKDYYAILGVSPSAEKVVIRAAWKALAQTYHPDKNPGHEDRMRLINEAYVVLSDDALRAEYDAKRAAKAEVPPPEPPPAQQSTREEAPQDKVAGPWSRFLARSIDLVIFGFLGSFAVGFALGFISGIPTMPDWMIIAIILCSTLIACFLEALFYHAAGNTPGKWLFQLKVLTKEGRPLYGDEYIKRNGRVFKSGLCYGLPVFQLVTILFQAQKLASRGATSYDEDAGYRVTQRPIGFVRGTLAFLLILFILATVRTFWGLVHGDIPGVKQAKPAPSFTYIEPAPAKKADTTVLLSDEDVFGDQPLAPVSEVDAAIRDLLREYPVLDNRTAAYNPQAEARMVAMTKALMQQGYPHITAMRWAALQLFGPPRP